MLFFLTTFAMLAYSPHILHASDVDDTHEQMCICAKESNICDKLCMDLLLIPDLSDECADYATQQICTPTGGFPMDQTYEDYCPTIGFPCTVSQDMCKCAQDNGICDKTCIDIFDVDDPDCNDYAAVGICGGEFPSTVTYEEHCPTVGMSCIPGPGCEDSPSRFKFPKNGKLVTKSCEWAARKNTIERCAISGVGETCPLTCETCETCADSPLRIKISIEGEMKTRSCEWAEKKNTIERCAFDGMAESCRVTCGSC